MAKDVLITPASSLVEFQDTSVTVASIYESNTDLHITANGAIVLGASNIELGDSVTAATMTFLGGGGIAGGSGMLNIGASGDTVNLNMAGVAYNLPNNVITSVDYTANNVLAKLLTVDGSGSGLDADLLDGIDSSRFSLSAYSTFISGDWNTLVGHGIYKIQHSSFASDTNYPPATYAYGVLVVDVSEIGEESRTLQVYYPHAVSDKNIYQRMFNNGAWTAWSTIWRNGSGSGSTLDADLLDGQHGSYYQNASNISTGTLILARGGTNAALTATAGAVAYSNSTSIALTAVGTSGHVLLSGGTSTPTWSSQASLSVGTANNVSGGTVTATSGTFSGTLGVTGAAAFANTVGITGTLTTGVLNSTSGTFSGTQGVTGAATFANTVGITGALTATSGTFSSTLGVTGATTLANTLTVTGTATFTDDLYVNGTYIYGDNKTIIMYSDTWLRLNPNNAFTSGIYAGTGILRTDGNLQVGNAGATLNVSGASFTYLSNNIWHAGNDGAGSTLDADLLDGQHGSYYTNASSISTGTLVLARGGTSSSLTAVAGAVAYSNSTAIALSAAGTAGQVLASAGTSAPVWIANNITVGTTSITLGSSSTTLTGLTSVNSSLYTVGTSITANTTGVYPSSNTVGTALGSTTQRWVINANTGNFSSTITGSAAINGAYLGVTNTSDTSGYGISLYGGGSSSQPTYGLMFAGTATFGVHGDVTSDWATYFTMSNTATRGWIFRNAGANTNGASISTQGNATFNGYIQAANGVIAMSNNPFIYNANTVSANVTIPSGYNAMAAGPVAVVDGAVITVTSGSTLVIV